MSGPTQEALAGWKRGMERLGEAARSAGISMQALTAAWVARRAYRPMGSPWKANAHRYGR